MTAAYECIGGATSSLCFNDAGTSHAQAYYVGSGIALTLLRPIVEA
jgi:hypothetical protein